LLTNMAFQARTLVCAAIVALCVYSVAAQATPNHGRGRGPKGCGFRRIVLSLPVSAEYMS
jgi:hypothetical protein